ncbi:MAG: type II toxin-antitoxin system VapC family toxin [Thioploca sp.]|nr:type II toxin-antitoxin system VapC family toxin [Thioploca sp.]
MNITRYLLDTNICIYIAKKQPLAVLERFNQLQVGEVAISLITLGELYLGIEKSQQADKARQILKPLLQLILALPLPIETAVHYARIRAALEKQGRPIGANDLWIAAHALTERYILVTNNVKEFARIPELYLENWLDQA